MRARADDDMSSSLEVRGKWAWCARAVLLALLGGACRPEATPGPEPETPEVPLSCRTVAPPPLACASGWCNVSPIPPIAFTAAWAAPGGSAWLAGTGALVEARDGTLRTLPVDAPAELLDVWASSDTNVWAVGRAGVVVHWDGQQLRRVPVPGGVDLTVVAGSSASDVWVGGPGGLLRRDGDGWATVALGQGATLVDIATAGPGAVWVSVHTQLLRCDASGCQVASATPAVGDDSYTLGPLLAFSGSEVLAWGSSTKPDGALLRWKDGAWTRIYGNTVMYGATAHLAGSSVDDVWLSTAFRAPLPPYERARSVQHFGTELTVPPASPEWNTEVTALASPALGKLYVLREWGAHQRLEAGAWMPLAPLPELAVAPTFETPRSLLPRERVFNLAPLRGNGPALATNISPDPRETWRVRRLSTDPSGVTWTAMATRPEIVPTSLFWTGGEDLLLEVWRTDAAGTSRVFQEQKPFRGGERGGRGSPVVGIHAISATHVWVASASDLLTWNGESWRSVAQNTSNTPPQFTGAVWAATNRKVWVGATNGVRFWDGQQIASAGSPSGGETRWLWGSSSRDVWAVSGPFVYRWDGASWAQVPLPLGPNEVGEPRAVVGRCDRDVYVVAQTAVFHWDGQSWTTTRAPEGVSLSAAADIDGELWVAGNSQSLGATVLRRAW